MALQIGDIAIDFTLFNQDGDKVNLSDYRDKKWVVLYFYPKDNTYGCTREACSFRDTYEDFTNSGAEVIGISSDNMKSHQSFRKKHQLPFQLLSDEKAQIRKQYGVPKSLGFLPGRVTYIIDPKGIIRHIFNSQLNFNQHTKEALKTISEK